jgi:hypothetical protein
MVHISSEAVRTRSREIEVGHSVRDFLKTLGIGTSLSYSRQRCGAAGGCGIRG